VEANGVDVVIESTGIFRTAEKPVCTWKLDAKVIISAPKGFPVPTFVYGVNHEAYSQSETMSSQLPRVPRTA